MVHMIKKHVLGFIIPLVLCLIVLFPGCVEEEDTTEKPDKSFEVSEFSIATEAYSHATGWKEFSSDLRPKPNVLPEIVTHEPPYHSEEFTKARYNISIIVTNIGESSESSVHATAVFYENDTVLFDRQFNRLSSIQPGESHEFIWNYYNDDETYQQFFYRITEIKVSPGLEHIDFDPTIP